MPRLHLHLLSDSTGETLEMIAKAGARPVRRCRGDPPFLADGPLAAASRPDPRRYRRQSRAWCSTPWSTTRSAAGSRNAAARSACRAVARARSGDRRARATLLGQQAKARPGRQHAMDAAYFARVDAIQFTIAHDDGIGSENWEEADIVLAGVSRTSKTPTSIYLANRGYKVANIPLVVESPPPPALFALQASAGRRPDHRARPAGPDPPQPPAVAQPGARDRLCRHRARSTREVAFARRMFADNGWPVIDVTRRSIEETAAAIINLLQRAPGRRRRADARTREPI